jgi:hypothetical protein
MNAPAIAPPQTVAATRRERLAGQLRRAEHAHLLATIDHVAEYVRTVWPQARCIEFAFHADTRTIDLGGIYGNPPTPLSGCPLLWEAADQEHPMAELRAELSGDVEQLLAPFNSPAWTFVHPNSASESNSWLMDLPPADRVARIAQLVRQHHPAAAALIVDFQATGGRVIQVIEEAEPGGSSPQHALWRWSGRADLEISQLLRHMRVLPDLSDRHFEPVPDAFRHPLGVSFNGSVYLLKLPTLP